EQAFLALTGTTIRDERADPAAQMRQFAKMWRRRRRRDLHSLAPRTEALHALARTDHRVGRAAAALSAGARIRPGSGLPPGRSGKLPAVRRAGRNWHVGAVHVNLLGHRPALGPPVRVL